jgi:hypothetical protein
MARIDQIFTHESFKVRCVFFKVTDVSNWGSIDNPRRRDEVLDLPILSLSVPQQGVMKFVGLPAVRPNKIYLLPVRRTRDADGGTTGLEVDKVMGGALLLYVPWTVEYL